MTKNIAAIERQGISTPKNVAHTSQSGNALDLRGAQAVLDNEMLSPLAMGQERLEQIEELFKVIRDLADPQVSSHPGKNQRCAELRIKTLSDMGAYLAADMANLLDCMHEAARDKHVPALLAALGGAA